MAIRINPENGKIIPHRFTLAQIEAADDAYEGFCLACGESRDCCEPDARKYPCEACGKKLVYGAQEIAMMGLLKDEEAESWTS